MLSLCAACLYSAFIIVTPERALIIGVCTAASVRTKICLTIDEIARFINNVRNTFCHIVGRKRFYQKFGNTGITGFGNTANGTMALRWDTTGYNNTAGGKGALQANTEGFANAASGFFALGSNTTGYNNTAIGYQALSSNVEGLYNTVIGS